MIQVTRTHLPNIGKYQNYVEQIYKNGWITNNGPLANELEKKLSEYLDVPYIVLISNGTLALHLAYRLLDIKQEVITSPFSFVATTSSIKWEGLTPVYSDVNPRTFNIDPEQIEKEITERTSCITPVHVFGNPCEIDDIQYLANKYDLKVIYDAAHTFGAKYKGRSLAAYGDIAVLSFHATKIFHTIEGGALIIHDEETYLKAKRLINFGFNHIGLPIELGFNAKMNEFQAAMGLCMLDEVEQIIKDREEVHFHYKEILSRIENINFQEFNESTIMNYSYFPIVLSNPDIVLRVKKALEQHDIYTRRYFYPSLDILPYVDSKKIMNESRKLSENILCLPMFDGLTKKEINFICDVVAGQLSTEHEVRI